MIEPLLSISIPTYNRAEMLRATLSNVFAQVDALNLTPGTIEVVVTSNASRDATGILVRELIPKHPHLRYFENDQNYGIDGNIHRAVLNARGRFVHLLSDDDVLHPGLYRHLHEALQRHHDIKFLFLNVNSMAQDKSPAGDPVVADNGLSLYSLPKDEFVETVGIWMTFISSFVVKRENWLDTPNLESHIGTDIYLSYVAFSILANAGAGYISTPVYISVRPVYSGNYRIFKAFVLEWRRLLLNFAPQLGFSRSVTRRILSRSTRNFLPGKIMLAKRLSALGQGELIVVLKNTWDIPAAWIFVYPVILLPEAVINTLRRGLRLLRKK